MYSCPVRLKVHPPHHDQGSNRRTLATREAALEKSQYNILAWLEPTLRSQDSKPEGTYRLGIKPGISGSTGSLSIPSAKGPGPLISGHEAVLLTKILISRNRNSIRNCDAILLAVLPLEEGTILPTMNL